MKKQKRPTRDSRVLKTKGNNAPLTVFESNASSQPKPMDRRRIPRLTVSTVLFRLQEGPHSGALGNGKVFPVGDLSEQGMGFWLVDWNDFSLFAVGQKWQGTLSLDRKKFPVHIQIKNMSKDRIGSEFISLTNDLIKALRKALDPAALGAALKPIPSPDSGSLWYHAPGGADLILDRAADGGMQSIVLYALDHFVKWEANQGVQTGTLERNDSPTEIKGIFRMETFNLIPDEQTDPKKLSVAKKVILGSNLPQDMKMSCVRKFDAN